MVKGVKAQGHNPLFGGDISTEVGLIRTMNEINIQLLK